MTTTLKDIDRVMKELNERTKQGYSYGMAYGGYKLENNSGSQEFSFRMKKGQFYEALYMLNKVLANEEYAAEKKGGVK